MTKDTTNHGATHCHKSHHDRTTHTNNATTSDAYTAPLRARAGNMFVGMTNTTHDNTHITNIASMCDQSSVSMCDGPNTSTTIDTCGNKNCVTHPTNSRGTYTHMHTQERYTARNTHDDGCAPCTHIIWMCVQGCTHTHMRMNNTHVTKYVD